MSDKPVANESTPLVADVSAEEEYFDDDFDPLMGFGGAAVILCGQCCLLFLALPWIVLDFVFANGESPCLTEESLWVDLRTWLLVQAHVMVLVAAVPWLSGVLALAAPSTGICAAFTVVVAGWVENAFLFFWTPVGGIVFWKTPPTCSAGLNTFVLINLVFCLASILLSCYKACSANQDRDDAYHAALDSVALAAEQEEQDIEGEGEEGAPRRESRASITLRRASRLSLRSANQLVAEASSRKIARILSEGGNQVEVINVDVEEGNKEK